MGKRVISQRKLGRAPSFEHRHARRLLLEAFRVDEAVAWWSMRGLQRANHAVGDFEASHANRQRAMHRQIVERQGHFPRTAGNLSDGGPLDIAARKGEEGRPIRSCGVATAVLAKRDIAIDQGGFHGRKLRGAQILLAQKLVDRPGTDGPQNMPLASTQPPSTCCEPLLMNTGRGAHKAMSS